MKNYTNAWKFEPDDDFTAVVRTSIIQILRTPGGPYHDWFMEGVRDTPRSKQLEEHIFVDGLNILRHYEGMRRLAEQITSRGKISHANAAVWEMYVTFAVAAVFAHYIPIVPMEDGSAEVLDASGKGQFEEEDGNQDDGGNDEDIGCSTSTHLHIGKRVRR
ncbi:hypothetical protein A0H81_09514 [Grifola frondosa]|uniref:Uncharacterized protein n=1 Tax=Grifola frondosa TaxID=5627 RepID=A0A1C7M2M0_GRIFR|nr:hypothetical protein A0H81_09514 [Grifola frondosa]